MVAGRTTEPRTVASVGTTIAVAAITGPAASFNEEDAGRLITGTGIPAGATILSVASDIAATLSANATATGAITATITGTTADAGQRYGFVGWSPETDAESETYTLAATNAGAVPPDRLTNSTTSITQRSRG
jgi:hypothetical protein